MHKEGERFTLIVFMISIYHVSFCYFSLFLFRLIGFSLLLIFFVIKWKLYILLLFFSGAHTFVTSTFDLFALISKNYTLLLLFIVQLLNCI